MINDPLELVEAAIRGKYVICNICDCKDNVGKLYFKPLQYPFPGICDRPAIYHTHMSDCLMFYERGHRWVVSTGGKISPQEFCDRISILNEEEICHEEINP